jgi:hypothetical protein
MLDAGVGFLSGYYIGWSSYSDYSTGLPPGLVRKSNLFKSIGSKSFLL